MPCAYHPTVEEAGYCRQCGRPLCTSCLQAAQRAGGCYECVGAPVPRRISTGLWIGLGLGCLALIIIAVIIAVVLLMQAGKRIQGARPEQGMMNTEIEEVLPGFEEASEPAVEEVFEEAVRVPGEEAALAFAHSRKPEWEAQVTYHEEDWSGVEVVIGPSSYDWRTWLALDWDPDASNYVLADEGPIGQVEQQPIAEEPEEDVPDIYRPGEQVALEAALMDTPDWVAKVVTHSSDWKQVTIWVGPPASEWATEITLQWNDGLDCYEVVSQEAIEYP